jgi:futalosine hydrolase
MLKILLVAATKHEVLPLINYYNINVNAEVGLFACKNKPNISLLLTGVGMVNTAFFMGSVSHHMFDCVINVGICGAFSRELELGEVVNIVSDKLSEMGAEDGDTFIKYEDLNLGGSADFKSNTNLTGTLLNDLKNVSGITVNKIHGNKDSIANVCNLYKPDVESMEGAAFFRACSAFSENYFQIRSISNYVEKRDKTKWNIPLAISNLNEYIIKLITELNK